jgi:hypothetical protein
MYEREMRQSDSDQSELGLRSRLLTPVVEGNTLGSEDVFEFLEGRLTAADGESGEARSTH